MILSIRWVLDSLSVGLLTGRRYGVLVPNPTRKLPVAARWGSRKPRFLGGLGLVVIAGTIVNPYDGQQLRADYRNGAF